MHVLNEVATNQITNLKNKGVPTCMLQVIELSVSKLSYLKQINNFNEYRIITLCDKTW